jgi:hypothetical protein
VTTDFKKGNTTYGVFTLASALEVCRCKYQKDPIVRQIDPVGLATYY